MLLQRALMLRPSICLLLAFSCAACASAEADAGEEASSGLEGSCPPARTERASEDRPLDRLSSGSAVIVTPYRLPYRVEAQIAYTIKDTMGALGAPVITVRPAPGYVSINLEAEYACANGGTTVHCTEGVSPKDSSTRCATTSEFPQPRAAVMYSGLRFSVDCAGADDGGELTIRAKNEAIMCAEPTPVWITVE
jgi:hypothetical protein